MLNRNPANKWSAFSLVELMITIVIVGILSVFALPAYEKYKIKAKYSEAYQNLGTMVGQQKAYYTEHGQFYTLQTNGVNAYDIDPECNSNSFRIKQYSDWDKVGYPVAVGSRTHFGYSVLAGKFDSTGTDVGEAAAVAPMTGLASQVFTPPMSRISYSSTDEKACAGTFLSWPDYGINTSPSGKYDWAAVYAAGILQPGVSTECHWVVATLEATGGGPPSMPRGFIQFTENTATHAGDDCLTTER